MNSEELTDRLRQMYQEAKGPSEKAIVALRFGIHYARPLAACADREAIVRNGTGRVSYIIDLQKGMRLARYVQSRQSDPEETDATLEHALQETRARIESVNAHFVVGRDPTADPEVREALLGCIPYLARAIEILSER